MGKEVTLPKNIRQIGDIQGKEKIFLEDYVMTYIKKKEKQEREGFLGIFLGERQEKEETSYVFIRGIMEVPFITEELQTSSTLQAQEQDNSWMEQMKKDYQEFFPECAVQGCCVIGMYPTERMRLLSEVLPEAGGLIYHLQEQEETIYRVENGRYRQIKGYFVFYEQNRNMQEYMSSVFSSDCVEKEGGSDQAIRNFRKKVKEKAVQKNTSFIKLASSFFVVTVLLVGAVMVNRISEVREMRTEITSADTAVENEVLYVKDMEDVQSIGGVVTEETDGYLIQEEQSLSVSSNWTNSVDSSNLEGPERFWTENHSEEETAEVNQIIENSSITDVDSSMEYTKPETMNFTAESTGRIGNEYPVSENTDMEGTNLQTEENTVSEQETKPENSDMTEEAASVRQIQAAYVIKEGDTLANICTLYYGNMERLAEICEVNEIEDPNRILPGQKIVLP